MRTLNSIFSKGILPASLIVCSFSAFSAMEVKGFSLSQEDAIRNIYGSCHRLEEPLVIKLHTNTDFVVGDQGWRFEIRYQIKEDKKYKTDIFSADNDKLTNQFASDFPVTNQNGTGSGFVKPLTESNGIYGFRLNASNQQGGQWIQATLPTRNIEFIQLYAWSYSNNRGGTYNFRRQGGNFMSGGAINGTATQIGPVTFNLLSVDHLSVAFVQTMGGVGITPSWGFEAVPVNFQDRGPYNAAQYKAACQ
ncbi:hypothetical protein [Citrobacter meridianamericanus]|uniref:hypothetical protein n=1 Tax=Citrobacter meridianamericanus TaxID=2894201 RepID=UPI00351D1415